MKTFVRIFVVFISILLLLIIAPTFMAFIGRKMVPEMTPEKAQQLFEAVGESALLIKKRDTV
jgi:hypothetical protein